MTAEDVVELYSLSGQLGIEMWIDGGWGVDALLGKQTRSHSDLDIAIEYRFVPRLREHLEFQGYEDIKTKDRSQWNFVMGDDNGRLIDFHAFVFNDDGNITDGIKYPKGSLTGTGTINGHTLRCIDPEYMVKFHTFYEPNERDFKDVSALCDRFDINLPKEYSKFINR